MKFLSLDRLHVALFSTVFLCAVASPGAESAAPRSGQVAHVILFWLKRPGNTDDQNVLLRGLRALRRIRGVNEMRVGRSLPVDRPGLEQSFDLGVVDSRRRGALDAIVQPLIRRYIIYNFANE